MLGRAVSGQPAFGETDTAGAAAVAAPSALVRPVASTAKTAGDAAR
jgi:hypothetical protein